METTEDLEVVKLNVTEEFNLIKSLYKQDQISLAEYKSMLEGLDNDLFGDEIAEYKTLLILINLELSEISTHH